MNRVLPSALRPALWLAIPVLLALGPVACRNQKVPDVDGNRYRTVEMGEQTWMAGDLRTTRLRDGSPLARVEFYEEWAALKEPAYCWYNNDSASSPEYGALYNAYAVETGQLCPEGWHIPSDVEWTKLQQYLRILNTTGGALKEEGTGHWRTPNQGATNLTGFTALPGGYRSYNGTFNLRRSEAYWWSSTEADWYGSGQDGPPTTVYRSLSYKTEEVRRHIANKASGFSVRCIKDRSEP